MAQTNFGDIMKGADDESFIPVRLREALNGTDWMKGDPYLRVVLTSNANMQRVMSAWYRDEIKVTVCFNKEVEEEKKWGQDNVKQYDRRVEIACKDVVFCVATSRVILTDSKAIEAVESGGIGIAQLYRHFEILPSFYLTDAGGRGDQGRQRLWREYVLSGGGIECRIREDFRQSFLSIEGGIDTTDDEPLAKVRRISPSPHLGDLLKGRTCVNTHEAIPENAHPLQRVLLTAAGNVVRLISSYHNTALYVGLLKSCPVPNTQSMYDREVLMFCGVHCVCRARTRITITDDKILKNVKEGFWGVGEIFRKHNLLPKFDLLRVDFKTGEIPGFGRHYTMKAEGVCCEIREEYADLVLHLSTSPPPEANSSKGIPSIFSDPVNDESLDTTTVQGG